MPTLAPKLPYTHPFAGGYPRLGGQPLPTDPDAIDYLNRVKAADGGAGVEVGVAMAVDAFVKGCKADGIWDALQASCILCGARTISGALVPLAGTAPTPYNFASGDYSRTTGLKGDGATKYLDTNRANDADGQNDNHNAVYISSAGTVDGGYVGVATPVGAPVFSGTHLYRTSSGIFARSRSVASTFHSTAVASSTGFAGVSRAADDAYLFRAASVTDVISEASVSPDSVNVTAFIRNRSTGPTGPTDARLAFYSIGSSLDLAALDTRVSTLVAAIAAAL